jgi:rRNA maturation RNase YbeY
MRQVEQHFPERKFSAVSVILTDHQGMIPVHEATFGRAETTDVVSLTYDPVPPEDDELSGEIVVNVQRAWEERRRGSASRELALYIAHGCDHLAGAEDDTEAQRQEMRNRELDWLRSAEDEGLMDDLLGKPRGETIS